MKKRFLFVLLGSICLQSLAQPKWFAEDIYGTDYIIEFNKKNQLNYVKSEAIDFYIHHNDEVYIGAKGFQFHLVKTPDIKNFDPNNDLFTKDKKYTKEIKKVFKQSDVQFEWLNANTNAAIEKTGQSNHYFTSGSTEENAWGYKAITYKNIYSKTDVRYEPGDYNGIHYTLTLRPGANLANIVFQYQGGLATLNKDRKGIMIENEIINFNESGLTAYYENGQKIAMEYVALGDNKFGFRALEKLDKNKKIIVDPWVSPITTLLGNANPLNKGYDVDYDLAGNLYVYGGGGASGTTVNIPKVAKYNGAGVLVWTFSGSLPGPGWYSNVTSSYVGNFIVDKSSGKIYIGQGYVPSGGSRVVRLNSNGVYDNFITSAVSNFEEVWDFTFNCNNGDLIAFGGSTSSNLNFAVIDTSTAAITTQSISNLPGNHQDVVCGVINPAGQCFVIFNGFSQPIHQDIYKINAAYTASIWNVDCGYNVLSYVNNKPYASVSSMSHNCLSITDSILYYYDGLNLKAFSQFTGAPVGTAIQIPGNTGIMQGGIYANNCEEIYIGGNNGNILKYNFNGTTFTANGSITIPGSAGKAVYDIKYNPTNKYLYVSGKEFVAQIDPLSTCIDTIGAIHMQVNTYCPDTAIVTINNPNVNVSYSFTWEDSATATIVQSVLKPLGVVKDTLIGFNVGSTYKITVSQVQACQLSSSTQFFKLTCGSDTTINLCEGDSYTLTNNVVVTTSGLYKDTFTNVSNQDSIVQTQLIFHPVYKDTVIADICVGTYYILPTGDTAFANGVFVDSFLTIANCDSIITSIVTIRPEYNLVVYDTICKGDNYSLPGGMPTNTPGTYYDSLLSIYGCDSLFTTHLYVKPSSRDTVTASFCANETFILPNGNVANQAGWYNSVFKNTVDCDSVITTNLIAVPNYLLIDDVTICSDATYTLPSGKIVKAAGVYLDSFSTVIGCDSVIRTNLSVKQKPVPAIGSLFEICPGDSIYLDGRNDHATNYLWENNSIDPYRMVKEEGTYIITLFNPPCGPVSDTAVVAFLDCDCSLAMVNAFSPNGDGLNDVYRPLLVCDILPDNFQFQIYNRWGQAVFTSDTGADAWDGTYKGVPQSIGTYYYFIKYTNPATKKINSYRGDITLIR